MLHNSVKKISSHDTKIDASIPELPEATVTYVAAVPISSV